MKIKSADTLYGVFVQPNMMVVPKRAEVAGRFAYITGDEANPDIPVGPTVDDFVTALVDHPSIDVTVPVDVTLAGYPGRYLDLQIPDDISACDVYRPLGGHHYAQGPGLRWHMWVLDVGGVRVLVETNDYPGTSAQRLAEEQAMIDSLEITP